MKQQWLLTMTLARFQSFQMYKIQDNCENQISLNDMDNESEDEDTVNSAKNFNFFTYSFSLNCQVISTPTLLTILHPALQIKI